MKEYVVLGRFSLPTNAHLEFLTKLKKYGKVKVGIARYFFEDKEVLTPSLPLTGYERGEVFRNYGFPTFFFDFYKPYLSYFGKFIRVKNQILSNLSPNSLIITRVWSHYFLLKATGFDKVKLLKREGVSGSRVRGMIYEEILTGEKTNWEKYVPKETQELVRKNLKRFKRFASSKDLTLKLFDFKIPFKGLI